jgi:hypothetical protein
LWWLRYSAINHLDYFNCPFLAAPFGIDFGFLPMIPINLWISKAAVLLTDYISSVNISTLLGFALTGLFAYALCYDLTKDKKAGFLCGLIFAFCPYHLNKVMEFTYVYFGTWLVLYMWALLKVKEAPTPKSIILASIAFTLTLAFSPYYGLFALIFTGGLLVFCFFYQWKEKILDFQTVQKRAGFLKRVLGALLFIKNLSLVFFVVLIINGWSLWNISQKIFFAKPAQSTNGAMEYARSFDYLIAQSARPASYLLPASTHPVFGGFTKKMFGSIFYGRGSIEQTLYLGWMPLILAYCAFRQWRQKRIRANQYPEYRSSTENFYIGFFLFSAATAFLCSLPPYADLGVFKIYFPSFFLYKVLPMFRAYARMGVLVSLCVAVLAGYGLKSILEKFRTQRGKMLFTTFIGLAILFEFTNIPPTRVTDISRVPEVYQWLAGQKGDFIIAEYPFAKAAAGEAQENCDYLFYQTFHQKRMFNGSVLGTDAYKIRETVSKIDSPETLPILKDLGVKYVIFHSEPYRKGDYKEDVGVVGEVPRLDLISGWKLVKTFGDIFIYEIR